MSYAVGYGGVSVHGGDTPSSSLSPGGVLTMGGAEYDPPPDPQRCHHRLETGEFCQRYPRKGEFYCPHHDPGE